MAEFVFTSPGVKFREKNLTFVTRNVGVTTLGLVGETLKGPAFEPIYVEDMGVFRSRFGGMSYEKYSNDVLRYQLPYVANSYLSESSQLWVTRVLGLSGYDAGKAWVISLDVSGSTNTEYDNMVLAVIRSNASVEDVEDAPSVTNFKVSNVVLTSTTAGDLYGDFVLTLTIPQPSPNPPLTKTIRASLNPDARNYLPNVIGNKVKGKSDSEIYVESIFTDLIRYIDANEIGNGIKTTLTEISTSNFTDYKTPFKTPKTPWIVSEVKGNKIDKLFRFISISDGSSANKEIKISIQNVDPITKEFDVIVRDFNDKDNSMIILESFSRCTLRKDLNNYVGARIGTIDGEHELKSKYVMLEINPNIDESSFPCGFEGYYLPDFESASLINPKIMYKQTYLQTDNLNRTYLGISERGYDTGISTGRDLNRNLFIFMGVNNENYENSIKTKGFHLDMEANLDFEGVGEFETGAGKFQTSADIISESSTYYDRRSRKFTLVPYGGFDGWDEHRTNRTHGDNYRFGGIFDGITSGEQLTTDFKSWNDAINTFSNPEDVTINLFATPSINWNDNTVLVRNTVDMIERQRTDTFYVIDAPNIDLDDIPLDPNSSKRKDVLMAEEIVGLLDETLIDSSYCGTYFPYIQMKDVDNNVNVWLPPTCEVVASIAFTDNSKFPWFAPAGIQRGTTSARKAKVKLSLEARDILYAGRINPMAEHPNTGVTIFGQKTLQIAENALDRINVRRMLLELKVLISNIATRLLFEQNDDTTVDEFLTKSTPILQRVQRERGLYDFRIVMDDTNNTPETRDRNELYGEIYLKPTRTLEFIGIGFTLTPSGASFDEVMS